MVIGSIDSPRHGKVMSQVQGPSEESSQEQKEPETGLETNCNMCLKSIQATGSKQDWSHTEAWVRGLARAGDRYT